MHAVLAALPLAAAAKSKLPFYLAGGALVAWALFVSVGVGLRRPELPRSPGSARVIMAISLALVIATGATAVITATRGA